MAQLRYFLGLGRNLPMVNTEDFGGGSLVMRMVRVRKVGWLMTAITACFGAGASLACDDASQMSDAFAAPVEVTAGATAQTIAKVVPATLFEASPCAPRSDAPAAGRVVQWTVLPDVAHVAEAVQSDQIQILDVRSAHQQTSGLLPQSTVLPYDAWRDPARPGLPQSDAVLSGMIGDAGLRLEQGIVIVAQSGLAQDMARAAYVHWVLTSLGAERVAILDGGFAAWEARGQAIVTDPMRREAYAADLTFGRAHLASDYEIYGIAMMQIEGQLLDVRDAHLVKRFDSQGRAMATTLPGAKSAPVQALLGLMGTPEGAAQVMAKVRGYAKGASDGPLISFSSTGELAALSWFFASQVAGMPDVRIYAEGVQGWKSREGMMFRAANVYDATGARTN